MAAPAPMHRAPAAVQQPHPVQAQSQQPGMFAQMASTAAGVAVGSTIGHTLGAGITGMFGGSSSEPAHAQEQQLQAQPVQYQQQSTGGACDTDARSFTKCLEASEGNFQACDFYLQQLKACQAAASQY
ncbi:hypothetical protein CANARDRAFT_27327 [[Candida] arabinofermentans NRRL YB-2248]|uniref:CHCH domain-containing protein n=1 Tax=[Candida] arabinofermentans NRRL YB-2248 TaxID=983967 RepID=A0A1E4T5F1_9ASCO|nr:hypothetical protein CANARDRAFT_27327 [[Candida] arabinofermentans NRRL YB-2248]